MRTGPFKTVAAGVVAAAGVVFAVAFIAVAVSLVENGQAMHGRSSKSRGAAEPAGEARDGGEQLLKQARGIFEALPKDMATREFPVTPDRVSLGRKLFFDPRVS